MSLNKVAAVTGAGLLFVSALVSISFQDTPVVHAIMNEQPAELDTVPVMTQKNREMSMREFDEMILNLEREMSKPGEDLRGLDLSEAMRETEMAMQSIDIEKILSSVETSLSKLNMDESLRDLGNSLQELEGAGREEVALAVKNAKVELEQARNEISKISKKEIHAAMAQARAEVAKAKSEISKLYTEQIINDAKAGITNAKLELGRLRNMFSMMEKDGLIHINKGFRIERRGNDLFINGEKQPASVAIKYKDFIRDDHFSIEIAPEQQ